MSLMITKVEPPKEPDAPPPVYQEYPKMMVHPHARKAAPNMVADASGRMVSTGEPIQPGDRFPPVTVMNEQQEAWHRSQGYEQGGAGSAAAFANAHAGPVASYSFHEYPKWVGHLLFNTKEEHEAHERVSDTMKADATPSPKAKRHTPKAA